MSNSYLDIAMNKVISQEVDKVLNCIKADIFNACSDSYHMPVKTLDVDQIFEIIDKYKKEAINNGKMQI